MADCAYCHNDSAGKDLLPGEETTCFWCGRRLVGAAAPVAVFTSSPVEKKAPLFPKPTGQISVPFDGSRARTSNRPSDEGEAPRLGEAKLAAAFACGALALCFASFPTVSWLTKPLSVVGLTLGFFGCWLPARRHGQGLLLPSAIVGLSALVLGLVGRWSNPAPAAPVPLVAVSINREEGRRQPLGDDEWTDASAQAVSLHDLCVQVISARLENVLLNKQGSDHLTPDKYLVLQLRVSFEGVVFKQFKYERWADSPGSPSKHPPLLSDDENNAFAQANFGPDASVAGIATPADYIVYGRPLTEVLVFTAPSNAVDSWQLTLPAGGFGLAGAYKFRIPRSMVEIAQ